MTINNIDELSDTLNFLIPSDYSIGIHGVTGNAPSYLEVADKIMTDGLEFKGWGGLLSNVTMNNQLSQFIDDDYRRIYDYCFSLDEKNTCVNMIVAVPSVMYDSDKNEYFLGHYNYSDMHQKGDGASGAFLPMTMFTEDIGYLPEQFIVGYQSFNSDSESSNFIPNLDFIGFKTEEEQAQFFDQLLKAGLDKYAYKTEVGQKLERIVNVETASEYIKQLLEYYKSKENAKQNL